MENLKNKSDFWKKCDVNSLAGHFHKYNAVSQFERLGQLYLNKVDLDVLFPEGKEIHSFDINLALDNDVSRIDAFTFRPFIKVTYVDKTEAVERMFHYTAEVAPRPEKTAVKVPLPFKDWLCANWMDLDVSLIDDVFAAAFDGLIDITEPNLPKLRVNKRLLSYHFNDKYNTAFRDFLRDLAGHLDQFVFYLGIDMNKFFHKDLFTFSPIYEVRTYGVTEEQLYKIRRSGLRCVPHAERGVESVYYEYSSPCPSSC